MITQVNTKVLTPGLVIHVPSRRKQVPSTCNEDHKNLYTSLNKLLEILHYLVSVVIKQSSIHCYCKTSTILKPRKTAETESRHVVKCYSQHYLTTRPNLVVNIFQYTNNILSTKSKF